MSSLRTLEFSLGSPKISFETQIKSSMKILGYPMKYEYLGVSNKKLGGGVSNDNLPSPMKTWESITKIWGL